jgi:cytochrome c oxidase subunit 2
MIVAIVLVVLVVASVLFHLWSPWWFTPLASNWGTIDATINLTFWVTGFVFVVVNLFMAYCVWRYRYREGARAHYEPENKKLEWWLTGLTTIGVVAMLAPGLLVWADFVTVPEDAAEVEVLGQQWHWSSRYPGEDGQFGTVDARFITDENPFGMNPDDPNGQDDLLVASPEVHFPIGSPIKVLLRSKDVLHNFTVAQFRVKMDLVPGLVSFLWLTPTRTGRFEILCQELCGVGHFVMRGMVVVDEQEDFDAWLASQPTYAEFAARVPGDAVAGQTLYAVCTACHGPQGEGNPALNSPKIAGQSAWYMKRQLTYFKEGARGAHPEDVYGQQMAAMTMTLADEKAIDDVVAYIRTLPDQPAPSTVDGDVARGEKIYVTCGACHGYEGQGIQATNAPRTAGMSDWYMVTQLKNFKNGIRGAHARDMYGMQMEMMAASLVADEAINDVVAYATSLR